MLNSNQSTKPNIVISLDESTNATSTFKNHNLIQHKSYEKIKNIFLQNILLLDKYEEEDKHIELSKRKFPHRHHETITILGERGSGKTSFLLNLENKLHKAEDFNYSDKISFLQILDPTLFENKQHVMLTIITIILNKVSETENKDENKKDNYEKYLNNLADGINLLDGIDSNISHKSIWDDSRINFNKGIEISMSGISFEEDFKRFIKSSLEYINKKIFVLIFDDIDTNIEKGWPVLEIIRKYLTTLDIQVIVSGDWDLFSKLVRVNQFKNLNGLKDIEEKCNCKDGYNYLKTIDVLEEQYLTKILKPENRIVLQNLQTLTRDINLFVTKENSNIKTVSDLNDNIEKVYLKLLSYSLGTNNLSTFENFKQIFLTLPLRSNIQLLSTYFKNKDKDDNLDFIDDLGKQFLTKLSRYDITYQELAELKEDTAIYFYIKKALELSKLHEDLEFESFLKLASIEASEDKDRNILFFMFKSHLTGLINYRHHIAIDWLLKIELFKHTYIYNKPMNQHDLKYLGFGLPTTALQFARRLNGYLVGINKSQSDYINGYVKVYKDKSKKGKDSYDYFLDQLNKLEDNGSYYLISTFLFNKVSLERASKFDLFGSIYFIIGLLSELISLENENDSIKKYFIGKGIFSSIVPYSDESPSSAISYDEIYPSNLFDNKLVKELEAWLKTRDMVEDISIDLLANTMDEFYQQELELPKTDNFGDYITLQIVYFLNALLSSELRNDFMSSKKIVRRIRNINYAIKMLNDNINKSNILDKKLKNDKITFFKFIHSCPIWDYLININQFNLSDEKTIDKVEVKKELDIGGLFASQLGITTEAEPEPKAENRNNFIKLLEGLKTHKLKKDSEDTNEQDVNQQKVEKIYQYNKTSLIEIFKENADTLNKYNINTESDLSAEIIYKYINVLQQYFPKGSKYTTANKKKILTTAIIEFNKL